MALEIHVKFKRPGSDLIRGVDIHPREPWILTSVYWKGVVEIWDYERQGLVYDWKVSHKSVRAAKFIDQKEWIVVGGEDNSIRVYDVKSHDLVKMFVAHQHWVYDVAVHPSRPYVLSCSRDETIKLWDWEKDWDPITFHGHLLAVKQVSFHPQDPNIFASASDDRTIKVWSIENRSMLFSLNGHGKEARSVYYSLNPARPLLISGGNDALVKVWDYESESCKATLIGHGSDVYGACFHPHFPYIFTGSKDETVRVWNGTDYRLEKTLESKVGSVWIIATCKTSDMIAVGGLRGAVLFDVRVIQQEGLGLMQHAQRTMLPHGKMSLSPGMVAGIGFPASINSSSMQGFQAADILARDMASKLSQIEQHVTDVKVALEAKLRESRLEIDQLGSRLEMEIDRRKAMEKTLMQALQKAHGQFREYRYQELQDATKDFSEESRLGEGGYGSVYLGKLHYTPVAIKVMAVDSIQGREQFKTEIDMLSILRHPHLVTLVGACTEKCCLVYEYMANGSLEDRLLLKGCMQPLPWYARMRIAAEVAQALLFLHTSQQGPIIHRDLKPANILLDNKFVSKLSDVGLAFIAEQLKTGQCSIIQQTSPVGDIHYIDPQYLQTGHLSPKCDIYSFGITLLEMLTGKLQTARGMTVRDIIQEALTNRDTFATVLDPNGGSWNLDLAWEVANLGFKCSEYERRQRPEMSGEGGIMPTLERIASEAKAAEEAVEDRRMKMLAMPNHFLCPITHDLMEEPVISADGHTYERNAIERWLEGHETSPMTNLLLENKTLVPNFALRNAIQQWREFHEQ